MVGFDHPISPNWCCSHIWRFQIQLRRGRALISDFRNGAVGKLGLLLIPTNRWIGDYSTHLNQPCRTPVRGRGSYKAQ